MPGTVAGKSFGLPESPEVSCLMAVYNAERYLSEAVGSLLAQSLANFELIIVDDGSTDGTQALLEGFSKRDSRVRVVRHQNQGLTRSLNVAAALARAPLLARMDGDDIADPERFTRQVHHLRQHGECVVVGSALTLIDPDGDPLAERPSPTAHAAIVEQLWRGIGAIPHPSAMMRREIFHRLGGYREEFAAAQDLDLWLRMAEVGRLANLPETLLRYRLHADSVTNRKRQLQLDCAQRAVRQARRRHGDPQADTFQMAVPSSSSGIRTLRGWARMALKSQRIAVARKHAWSAFRNHPWWPAHWWLLARTYIGTTSYFPQKRSSS